MKRVIWGSLVALLVLAGFYAASGLAAFAVLMVGPGLAGTVGIFDSAPAIGGKPKR